MKAVLVVLITSVVLLLGVIVVRTILHQPGALGRVEMVAIIDLDEDLIGHHLSEAIRFRTVSYQQPGEFQAQEFEAFIGWVKNTYPEANEAMELTRFGGYTLLYRWEGSNPSLKPILMAGHYDVVPVIPGSEKQWQHPPFSGDIVDGVIWGRGALDDKSGVVAQLEAVTYLAKSGFAPKRTIYFSFGHDEEVGGTKGAAKVVEYLADQGVQLAWSLDEGSFLFDGILPGVESLMATINVAEKGTVTLNIIAKAAGGHSSMPPRQTAVGILAEAITALEAKPFPGGLSGLSEQMFDTASRYMSFGNRVLFANRWLFGGLIEDRLSAVPLTNAFLRTTTAPTMLSGSVKINVLPIEAVATVNFRLHPRDSIESVVDHVKSVVKNANVAVQLLPGAGKLAASPVSSWDTAGYRVVERAIREIYGEVVVFPGLLIGGSDSRHYGKVADDAYRFNPMTVSQEDLTTAHGTDEKISVMNLTQGTRAYVRIISLGSME